MGMRAHVNTLTHALATLPLTSPATTRLRYHMFSVILPALLFTSCCYLSFWIDRKVRPATCTRGKFPCTCIRTVTLAFPLALA